jgi:hypothetical protein
MDHETHPHSDAWQEVLARFPDGLDFDESARDVGVGSIAVEPLGRVATCFNYRERPAPWAKHLCVPLFPSDVPSSDPNER